MDTLLLPFSPRFIVLTICAVVTALLVAEVIFDPEWFDFLLIPIMIFGGLTVLGVRDVMQKSHAVLRNYPISAHIRFLLEEILPHLGADFFQQEADMRRDRVVAQYRMRLLHDVANAERRDDCADRQDDEAWRERKQERVHVTLGQLRLIIVGRQTMTAIPNCRARYPARGIVDMTAAYTQRSGYRFSRRIINPHAHGR